MESKKPHALVQHYAAHYPGILPIEHSLNFFVHCSEARVRRLKHGTRLTDAVQSHHNIFIQAVRPRKALIPSETDLQLLKQGSTLGLGRAMRSSTEAYYPLDQLVRGVRDFSPALREYQACKAFRPDLERKKHQFLSSYFLERYSRLSAEIDKLPKCRKLDQSLLFSDSNTHFRRSVDPFIDKIDRIDEEIREEMREKEEMRLKEQYKKAQELRYIETLRRTEARIRPKRVEMLRPKIEAYLNSAIYPETPEMATETLPSPRSLPLVLSPEPFSERSTGLEIELTGRGKKQLGCSTPSSRIKKAVARALDFQ